MNMVHYYKAVFSQFFTGRHWTWVEYDYGERTYATIPALVLWRLWCLAGHPRRSGSESTSATIRHSSLRRFMPMVHASARVYGVAP
jgi:hypothetical protein